VELEYHSVIVMDQHLHGLNRRVDGNVTYSLQEIILEIAMATNVHVNVYNPLFVLETEMLGELLTGWLIGMDLLLLVTGVIVHYV